MDKCKVCKQKMNYADMYYIDSKDESYCSTCAEKLLEECLEKEFNAVQWLYEISRYNKLSYAQTLALKAAASTIVELGIPYINPKNRETNDSM